MKRKHNRTMRTRGGGLLWACMAIVLLCSPVNAQVVDDVFILLSSNALPYQKAADSLASSLAGEQLQSTIILSKDLEGFDYESLTENYLPNRLWVAIGSRAASQLNTLLPLSMPLVYCMVANPEKIGLGTERQMVAGVSVTKPVWEQFAIIQTALPDLDSIGMLYRSSSEKSMQILAEAKRRLPEGWRLEVVDVDAMVSVAAAIQALFKRDIDLIWTRADSSIYNRATVKSLLLASLRSGTPVFGFSGSFVRAGALLGLEADPALQGQYAATLVLKCIGQDAAGSCLLSSGVTLAINMVVADRLGIVMPKNLLSQAEVIRNP